VLLTKLRRPILKGSYTLTLISKHKRRRLTVTVA
jgi:hypothetical protein